MKVFLAFYFVASAFAYPQYGRYDPYNTQQGAQTKPCSVCQESQEMLHQSGSPVFQPSDQPGIRYDRSIIIEEAAPFILNSPETAPILVDSPSPRFDRGIIQEEIVPVQVKTADSDGVGEVSAQEQAGLADQPEEVIIQETTGPVAERVVLLRKEGLRRESRSPVDTSSVSQLTTSTFDDPILPVLTDFQSQYQNSDSFMRHARSVPEEPTLNRVARSAIPQVVPILTNIPAKNIDAEMIESILRSARSIPSADSANVAASVQPVIAQQPAAQQLPAVDSTKDVSPSSGKTPQSFGMYYVRVKSINYLDDDLPAALKGSNSVTANKPCTKEQGELQKKYFEEQDKEFINFMQELLVQQFTSLLEQQLVQQQDQLKKFLNKQLEDELKITTPCVPTTNTPGTRVSETFAPTKGPETGSGTAEKIEVTVVGPVIPVKDNMEAILKEKAQ